jgi:parvulin-like peptidyl-prolyl cis-trans isomerase-like protein
MRREGAGRSARCLTAVLACMQLYWSIGCSRETDRSAHGGRPARRIDAASIAAVRTATGQPHDAVVAALSDDLLLSEHLRASDPARAAELGRIALGRAALVDLAREAAAQGPPTDAEVEALSAERWWQYARPRMARVIHAVVLSDQENPAALRVARQIAAAVASASDAEAFRKAAEAVPAEGFSVKVEELPPVTADGRSIDPEQPPPRGPGERKFDPDFARAAAELNDVGAKSPVVHTKFGYHVMQLVGSIPQLVPTLEERRAMLHDEILLVRGRALEQKVLDRQRSARAPVLERSALELTGQLEGFAE